MKSFLKRALKQLIVLVVITWIWYAWFSYFSIEKETDQQFVNRIHDFYIDSGYNKKSLYQNDIELLQEFKQTAVDSLTYKQTLDYIAINNWKMTGLIDNDWLNLIDETLKLANEWIARVDVPEYLTVDSKKAIIDPTPSQLLDQGLSLGMTEAKQSPVKKILK